MPHGSHHNFKRPVVYVSISVVKFQCLMEAITILNCLSRNPCHARAEKRLFTNLLLSSRKGCVFLERLFGSLPVFPANTEFLDFTNLSPFWRNLRLEYRKCCGLSSRFWIWVVSCLTPPCFTYFSSTFPAVFSAIVMTNVSTNTATKNTTTAGIFITSLSFVSLLYAYWGYENRNQVLRVVKRSVSCRNASLCYCADVFVNNSNSGLPTGRSWYLAAVFSGNGWSATRTITCLLAEHCPTLSCMPSTLK